VRFSLPIAPDASRELDWLIIALSLIAVVYIGFVALAQRDMKKLIAYSSIAHMGFVTLGMFIGFQIVAGTGRTTGIQLGMDGAIVQMLSHGLVLFALANSGLPGTSGFIGEFLVILASFKANVWYALLAATILVLGAAYTLWLVKRVIFGEVGNDKVAALKDLNGREFLVLGALAAAVLLVGLWPAPLLDVMSASTQHLAQQLLVSKIAP
jgi:NADH-quinone oxidoreductase subunit M